MILDIVIVALIALSVYLGYRKGLVKLAIGIVSILLSLVITAVLYIPISNLVINVTNIDETIENAIYEKVMEDAAEEKADDTSSALTQAVAQGTLPTAARGLSVSIVRLGVFVVLCLASRVIIGIVAKFADALAKLPLINQFNRAGGVICGLVRGLLVTYVALLIVAYITQINPDNGAYKAVEDSYLTKAMYDNNIVGVLFKVK